MTQIFMEELLKKQQKIKFSGASTSHQNVAAERAIKMVVPMARNMLIHSALRCPEDIFPLIFCQWQYIMMYGSIIGSLPFSMDCPLLKYGQGQGLIHCQKT